MSQLFKKISKTIKKVTNKNSAKLHTPIFIGKENLYLKDCIKSTFVSTSGKYISQFEEKIKKFTGAKNAVAVVNGTVALQMALRGLGVKIYDEILIPTLTFVGTANAVKHCGAIPHFVDSDKQSLGICLVNLEKHLKKISIKRGKNIYNRITGRRIFAIIPVHVYGHIIDMKKLKKIANKFNLKILEDAAESLGSFYLGKHSGTMGDAGIISFNANKVITTGGGGVILTNSALLAKEIRHLISTAKLSHSWKFVHDKVAWNYRMPNINAALGCAQIEKLPHYVECKRRTAAKYLAWMADHDVQCVTEPAEARSNYWLNAIILSDIEARNDFLSVTNGNGVITRPMWTPMHTLPMFKKCLRCNLDATENIESRLVCLPSSVRTE